MKPRQLFRATLFCVMILSVLTFSMFTSSPRSTAQSAQVNNPNAQQSANTGITASPAAKRIEPHEAGRVKTRLIKKMLERLNAEPERALFPKENMR